MFGEAHETPFTNRKSPGSKVLSDSSISKFIFSFFLIDETSSKKKTKFIKNLKE